MRNAVLTEQLRFFAPAEPGAQKDKFFQGCLFLIAEIMRTGLEMFHRENGNIAHPIPTPISRNRIRDHKIYLTRSNGRRRLKNPNATETASANSSIERK